MELVEARDRILVRDPPIADLRATVAEVTAVEEMVEAIERALGPGRRRLSSMRICVFSTVLQPPCSG
jgi:hypothetical protein